MTTINIYLTFNGDCEAAFEFYKSAFGGEFLTMSRFNEMPPDPQFPVAEEDMEKIMHVSLPISKESVLMGSDTGGEWAKHYKQGNNFSVSIATDSKEEADRLFYVLSEEGRVTMPMSDTFWESYFGMFTDKFGIQWMVSFDNTNREK